MGKNEYEPLFETRASRGRLAFKLYAASVVAAIWLIWLYRIKFSPNGGVERLAWFGLFLAELWFSFYWFVTQVVRLNPVYRHPFRNRLSQRYDDKELPGIDIFVCTADPEKEPPLMVANTVLSVMAYDYPAEKLSVYLSDDGGSELTFYAMLEASKFAKHWIPFCSNFKIEPRSPEAYFRTVDQTFDDSNMAKEWLFIKKLYMEMKKQIEATTKGGQVSDEIRSQHEGFREWQYVSSRRDHQTILQIITDGRDVDEEGKPLPTLVYLAREKRPRYHHNFKAGAMNALIRVSSKISNGAIVLNLDCDMYSNNSNSVRDILCFFMDEEQGDRIAYVQYPQTFGNLTKNDIYSGSLNVINQVEHRGIDGNGGPCYIGTGCFHRREALCGKKYSNDYKVDWRSLRNTRIQESREEFQEVCKVLASCTYEHNTLWGKEMGVKYGCPVEDMITGLAIQCRGWRSLYYNPAERLGFLGLAPATLLQALIQHKRWSEGNIQIFLSSYCPFIYGHKRIPLMLQLSYGPFLLWAANSLPTLYYVTVPSLCMLRGISLFPKASSPWFAPFAYTIAANRAYGLVEYVWFGGTFKGWWNDQRMWMFKRVTSYFFGLLDYTLKLLGFTKSAFIITEKIASEDESERYEKEVMEFCATSVMFKILATLALLNMFAFVGGIKKMVVEVQSLLLDQFLVQIILCGLLVIINIPIYQGLFFRKDSGRMPSSITYQSSIIALLLCSVALY